MLVKVWHTLSLTEGSTVVASPRSGYQSAKCLLRSFYTGRPW